MQTKVSETAKVLKEIFLTGSLCKKILSSIHWKNDQILDFRLR